MRMNEWECAQEKFAVRGLSVCVCGVLSELSRRRALACLPVCTHLSPNIKLS